MNPTSTALKEARLRLGLSQRAAAEITGVSERSYRYYEALERIPDIYTVRALSRALNTPIDELYPDQSK